MRAGLQWPLQPVELLQRISPTPLMQLDVQSAQTLVSAAGRTISSETLLVLRLGVFLLIYPFGQQPQFTDQLNFGKVRKEKLQFAPKT